MFLLFVKSDNPNDSEFSTTTATPVPTALPEPAFLGDSATVVILAVSVLVGAIGGLIRVLVPVMMQRTNNRSK